MGCLTGCIGVLLILVGAILFLGEAIGFGFAVIWGIVSAVLGTIGHIFRAIFH